MAPSATSVLIDVRGCLKFQSRGGTALTLECSKEKQGGLGFFLKENEFLECYRNGFTVWSTAGVKLWSREVPIVRFATTVYDCERSVTGNRFAIWLTGTRKQVFDGLRLSQDPTLTVYDAEARRLVFSIKVKQHGEDFAFALSPDGSRLAVLNGSDLSVYEIK